MAWTAHADPEQLIERNEAIESVTEKAQQIADLIRKAKHFCVFTGAGISTAAGIPDYRGPEGVWTLAATGGKRTKPVVGTLKAMPTPTHMALVKLQDEGLLKLLISQNCDGIHRKTGIKPSRIAELHGNTNLEKCSKCGKEYIRDFDATASYAVSVKDHKTGRICSVPGCYGELEDSIVNFGESLPEKVIGYAWENTEQCDFMLVLGSSLTVSPACWMPKKVGTNETLAICNLQKTPLDRLSKIRVFTKTDDLMIAIMKELGLEIPPFILKRLLRVNYEKKGDKIALTVTGIDDTNIAATFMEGVEYLKDDKTKVALKQRRDDFVLEVKCPAAEDSIKIKLYFMGHYNEPALILDIPIKDKDYLVAYPLAYNPLTGKWVVNEVIPQEKMPTLKPAKVKQTKEELEEKMKKVAQLGNLVSWPGALQTSGDGPEKCSGASMTYIDGKVYVFGGYFENSQEKKYYGDLRILDLSTMSWALCKSTEETPCARSGHSAVAINKKLYIFGGSCCFKPRENDERYFNDVHVFDTTTSTWEKMKCDGDIPAPRSFQSVFTKDHKIYIFGGSTIVPEDFFDDLLCLDTTTGTWSNVKTTNEGPSARDGASATVIGNKVFFIGGYSSENGMEHFSKEVFCLRLDSMSWEKIPFQFPPFFHGMAWHTADVLPSDDYPRIFTYGGALSGVISKELFIFDVSRGKMHRVKQGGAPPGPRFFHAMCKIGRRQVLVSMGAGIPYTPTSFYSDIHTMALPQ